MKKIVLSIFSLAILTLLFFSCSKKDDIQPIKKRGQVEFGFSMKPSLKSSNQKLNMNTATEPFAVIVSIKNSNDDLTYSMEKVNLYNMNGYYISKPLSLLPGSYTVEKFLVVDASDSIIYASPLQYSSKAYLITNPLPNSFTISKDSVTKVVPEVLGTIGSTPEDFGYSTFSFDVVNTFDFLIGVFVYKDSITNFEMTTANLNITAGSNTIFADTLEAITNRVTVNDGYTNYILTVTKDGYKNWTDTLTSTELKLYFRSADKGPLVVVLEKGCNCPPTVTDIDGNIYETITIGNQCWMKENLKVIHYNNGDPIPNVTDGNTWGSLSTGAYCDYGNTPSNSTVYGKLYNWYTVVDSRNLSPAGWHTPSDAEWTALTTFLGGESIAGGKMKEEGTSHWVSPNTGATNESDFTALPCGLRHYDGTFSSLTSNSYWWSTTSHTQGTSFYRGVYYFYASVENQANPQNDGMSVRCIKD